MKNIAVVLSLILLGYSLNAHSQAKETAPAATPATNQPTDYGKDAASMKLKKRIISLGFFSPLNHHISFGYDQLMGTDIVFTGQFGIIEPELNVLGASYANGPRGAFGEAGVKLFFSPNFVTIGTMRYNSMQGGYFKPQIVVSGFSDQFNSYTGAALLLNLGKQWVFANIITLDMYAGIGYSVDSSNGYYEAGNYYSYLSTGVQNKTGLAFSAGLNIGVLF